MIEQKPDRMWSSDHSSLTSRLTQVVKPQNPCHWKQCPNPLNQRPNSTTGWTVGSSHDFNMLRLLLNTLNKSQPPPSFCSQLRRPSQFKDPSPLHLTYIWSKMRFCCHPQPQVRHINQGHRHHKQIKVKILQVIPFRSKLLLWCRSDTSRRGVVNDDGDTTVSINVQEKHCNALLHFWLCVLCQSSTESSTSPFLLFFLSFFSSSTFLSQTSWAPLLFSSYHICWIFTASRVPNTYNHVLYEFLTLQTSMT